MTGEAGYDGRQGATWEAGCGCVPQELSHLLPQPDDCISQGLAINCNADHLVQYVHCSYASSDVGTCMCIAFIYVVDIKLPNQCCFHFWLYL